MTHVLVEVSFSGIGIRPAWKFLAQARFSDDAEAYGSWDVIVDSIGVTERHQPFQAYAEFLSPAAPSEKLREGVSFELYRGEGLLGSAKVLTELPRDVNTAATAVQQGALLTIAQCLFAHAAGLEPDADLRVFGLWNRVDEETKDKRARAEAWARRLVEALKIR